MSILELLDLAREWANGNQLALDLIAKAENYRSRFGRNNSSSRKALLQSLAISIGELHPDYVRAEQLSRVTPSYAKYARC